MEQVVSPNMWLEALKQAPGIAGMAWVSWLAYKRSHDAEIHVQTISDKFLAALESKDKQLTELIDRVVPKQ
jgi:hypothetical protein